MKRTVSFLTLTFFLFSQTASAEAVYLTQKSHLRTPSSNDGGKGKTVVALLQALTGQRPPSQVQTPLLEETSVAKDGGRVQLSPQAERLLGRLLKIRELQHQKTKQRFGAPDEIKQFDLVREEEELEREANSILTRIAPTKLTRVEQLVLIIREASQILDYYATGEVVLRKEGQEWTEDGMGFIPPYTSWSRLNAVERREAARAELAKLQGPEGTAAKDGGIKLLPMSDPMSFTGWKEVTLPKMPHTPDDVAQLIDELNVKFILNEWSLTEKQRGEKGVVPTQKKGNLLVVGPYLRSLLETGIPTDRSSFSSGFGEYYGKIYDSDGTIKLTYQTFRVYEHPTADYRVARIDGYVLPTDDVRNVKYPMQRNTYRFLQERPSPVSPDLPRDQAVEKVLSTLEEKGIKEVFLLISDGTGDLKEVRHVLGNVELKNILRRALVGEVAIPIGELTYYLGPKPQSAAKALLTRLPSKGPAPYYIAPDPYTLMVDPFDSSRMMMMAEVITKDGKPFENDARYRIRQFLQKLWKENRYIPVVGLEPEWFLITRDEKGKPLPTDLNLYYDRFQDHPVEVQQILLEAINALLETGISMINTTSEVAGSQHEWVIEARFPPPEVNPALFGQELPYKYLSALRTLDDFMLYKYFLKETAKRHGKEVTFEAKPFAGVNGSGMHHHLSISQADENGHVRNLFSDPANPVELSRIGQAAAEGVMRAGRETFGLIIPSREDMARHVRGYEAPVLTGFISEQNRSAAIRRPKATSASGVRFEYRVPAPDSNMYQSAGVILSSALYGIKNNLEMRKPVVGQSLYKMEEENPAALLEHLSEEMQEKVRTGQITVGQALETAKVPATFRQAVEIARTSHQEGGMVAQVVEQGFLTDGMVDEILRQKERQLKRAAGKPYSWEEAIVQAGLATGEGRAHDGGGREETQAQNRRQLLTHLQGLGRYTGFLLGVQAAPQGFDTAGNQSEYSKLVGDLRTIFGLSGERKGGNQDIRDLQERYGREIGYDTSVILEDFDTLGGLTRTHQGKYLHSNRQTYARVILTRLDRLVEKISGKGNGARDGGRVQLTWDDIQRINQELQRNHGILIELSSSGGEGTDVEVNYGYSEEANPTDRENPLREYKKSNEKLVVTYDRGASPSDVVKALLDINDIPNFPQYVKEAYGTLTRDEAQDGGKKKLPKRVKDDAGVEGGEIVPGFGFFDDERGPMWPGDKSFEGPLVSNIERGYAPLDDNDRAFDGGNKNLNVPTITGLEHLSKETWGHLGNTHDWAYGGKLNVQHLPQGSAQLDGKKVAVKVNGKPGKPHSAHLYLRQGLKDAEATETLKGVINQARSGGAAEFAQALSITLAKWEGRTPLSALDGGKRIAKLNAKDLEKMLLESWVKLEGNRKVGFVSIPKHSQLLQGQLASATIDIPTHDPVPHLHITIGQDIAGREVLTALRQLIDQITPHDKEYADILRIRLSNLLSTAASDGGEKRLPRESEEVVIPEDMTVENALKTLFSHIVALTPENPSSYVLVRNGVDLSPWATLKKGDIVTLEFRGLDDGTPDTFGGDDRAFDGGNQGEFVRLLHHLKGKRDALESRVSRERSPGIPHPRDEELGEINEHIARLEKRGGSINPEPFDPEETQEMHDDPMSDGGAKVAALQVVEQTGTIEAAVKYIGKDPQLNREMVDAFVREGVAGIDQARREEGISPRPFFGVDFEGPQPYETSAPLRAILSSIIYGKMPVQQAVDRITSKKRLNREALGLYLERVQKTALVETLFQKNRAASILTPGSLLSRALQSSSKTVFSIEGDLLENETTLEELQIVLSLLPAHRVWLVTETPEALPLFVKESRVVKVMTSVEYEVERGRLNSDTSLVSIGFEDSEQMGNLDVAIRRPQKGEVVSLFSAVSLAMSKSKDPALSGLAEQLEEVVRGFEEEAPLIKATSTYIEAVTKYRQL